ncbi:MAG: hypothetical protein ACTHK7_21545 [Aureliella sp.]
MRRHRGGFADPDWLVCTALGLVVAGLLLPFVRREGWIGWLVWLAIGILVLPFVLLVLTSTSDRIHAAAVSARRRRSVADRSDEETVDEEPLHRSRTPDGF